MDKKMKNESSVRTTPRIGKSESNTISMCFKTLNAGVEQIVNTWPSLYRRTMAEIIEYGELTQEELTNVVSGMRNYNNLAEYFVENNNSLFTKYSKFTAFQRFCLEVWIKKYWMKYNTIAIKPENYVMEIEKEVEL